MSSSSSSNSPPAPYLKEVNPQAGQAFLLAAGIYAVNLTPCISFVIRGSLPIEMLEHEQTQYPGYLGRRAGTYNNPEGKVATEHQTLNQYRSEIITKRAGDSMIEAQAIASLFPVATSRAREKSRETLNAAILGLLSKIMYVWPTSEVKLLMAQNDKLTEAYEQNDLLKWYLAFQQFCLSGAGNPEVNKDRAEKRISNLKMKNEDFLEYIKQFREAAEDLKLCNSDYTQERINTFFFQNLDQSEFQFYRFYRRFLDKYDEFHQFRTKTLSEAITIVHEYYDEVIRAAKLVHVHPKPTKNNPSDNSNSNNPPVDKPDSTVLFVGTPRKKRKTDSSADTRANKPRVNEAATTKPTTTPPIGKAPNGRPTNAVCITFQTDNCKYGKSCKFLHIKSK